MFIRSFKKEEYETIKEQLMEIGEQNPLEAGFNISIEINKKEYILKIQPEGRNQLAALHALEIKRNNNGKKTHTLFTDAKTLAPLFEIVLWQMLPKA